MLELRGISYGYPAANLGAGRGREGREDVLSSVDLAVRPGERVAILGPNGSGKSTLLRCAATQLAPCTGNVVLDGRLVASRADGERLRRRVGVVGQDPANQIVAARVFDEVAFGPCNLGRPPETVRADVAAALAACDLEGLEQRDVSTLSGGQCQRVALAGVVAMHPDYLLLDEPCSMLDPLARTQLHAVVARLARQGTGVLHVTHELAEVMDYDRVVVLVEGRVLWEGTPRGLLGTPAVLERSCCLVSPWLRWVQAVLEAGLLSCAMPLDDPERCGALLRGQGPEVVAAALALMDEGLPSAGAPPSPSMAPRALRGIGLSFAYGPNAPWALQDASASVAAGEALLVAGRTGSGKSTLAQVLAGLRVPRTGQVQVDGKPLGAGTVAYAFQRAEDQLFAATVLEDVAFGPRNLGFSKARAQEMARGALELVGLDPERWGAVSPFALSGGQMRRVALAGVLAMESPYVVFDEPTVGLDAQGYADFARLLAAVRERGVGAVVVSHDIELMAPLVTDALLMVDGRGLWSGPAVRLLTADTPLEQAGLGCPGLLRCRNGLGV